MNTSLRKRSGRHGLVLALAGVAALALTGIAEARPGGKSSFGSRGSRTFAAPPVTRTAPSTAQPIQRSQTTPSQAQMGQGAAAAQVAQPARSRFGGGFFAGLLGAGLLGALFGAGLFGGLGSLASVLGLVLQVALIGGAVYLAIQFFRRRQQTAPAGAGATSGLHRSSLGGPTSPLSGMHSGAGSAPARNTAASVPAYEQGGTVEIGPEDYEAFERGLHGIQMAYGREDVAALWTLATPEMAGYLQEELNENARNGIMNTIAGVKLLQGDLAEAWREGVTDYATVAMCFELTEQIVDRTTRAPVQGSSDQPVQVKEIWTFRRDAGETWKLSAIQQPS